MFTTKSSVAFLAGPSYFCFKARCNLTRWSNGASWFFGVCLWMQPQVLHIHSKCPNSFYEPRLMRTQHVCSYVRSGFNDTTDTTSKRWKSKILLNLSESYWTGQNQRCLGIPRWAASGSSNVGRDLLNSQAYGSGLHRHDSQMDGFKGNVRTGNYCCILLLHVVSTKYWCVLQVLPQTNPSV